MLERYIGENALRFHMPGHKGLLELSDSQYDVTEVPGTDSLFDPQEGILEACREAAKCWNAASSFLLVNGSTAGIQAMVLWAKAQSRGLLLPRDSHISAMHACAIADLQPMWLEPDWNAEEQLFEWRNEKLKQYATIGKSAFFITYPDYYGRCIDLSALKQHFLPHDCALLADSAHGAHFAFSKKLPPDAGLCAELWVTGAHKTLPAPTQTAYLHVNDRTQSPDVARFLRGVTTTSPSYLLMTGLDNGRAYMQANAGRLEELIGNCADLAERLNAIAGLRCWMDSDMTAMGYGFHDPTRLVVDVRGLGLSGWEAGARLRAYGLQAELCDGCRVVLIATVMDGRERLDGVFHAFLRLASERKNPAAPIRLKRLPAHGTAVMSLRQAWLSDAEEVDFSQSEGRIAAEPFGAYPPGIPLCMPGEAIGRDAIEAIAEIQALGGQAFGIRSGKISLVKD